MCRVRIAERTPPPPPNFQVRTSVRNPIFRCPPLRCPPLGPPDRSLMGLCSSPAGPDAPAHPFSDSFRTISGFWPRRARETPAPGRGVHKAYFSFLTWLSSIGHFLKCRSLKGRCNIWRVRSCVCVCSCVCPSSPPNDPPRTVGLNSRIPPTPVHDPSRPFPHPYPQAIARPTLGKNYPLKSARFQFPSRTEQDWPSPRWLRRILPLLFFSHA